MVAISTRDVRDLSGSERRLFRYTPKLSSSLESHLQQSRTLDPFLDLYESICLNFPAKHLEGEEDTESLVKIGVNYAHVLHQLLEIGFKTQKREYVMIGGMAVLLHLNQHGAQDPVTWRGSEDIDILTGENLSEVYDQLGFRHMDKHIPGLRSKGLPTGRLYSYHNGNPYYSDKSVEVQDRKSMVIRDLRSDDAEEVLQQKILIKFYGVPIKVISPQHLIDNKVLSNRPKDRVDAKALRETYQL